MQKMQTLTQLEFQAAFEHGAVQSVEIEPMGGRFAVKLITLRGEAVLVQARKMEPRLFGTVDSALKLLHKLGVRRIALERLELWKPEQSGQGRGRRPDRSEALSRAAEYDRWVRAKVEASRSDPRAAIDDDEWKRIRAAKLAERKVVLAP